MLSLILASAIGAVVGCIAGESFTDKALGLAFIAGVGLVLLAWF